ncbi:ATP-dependent helicase, partial [filamentous cyanobacterium CCP5]
MAILHGSWLPEAQRFFLWGEAWQRTEPAATEVVLPHPYTMGRSHLSDWLKEHAVSEGTETSDATALVLPKSLWKQLSESTQGAKRSSKQKTAGWGTAQLSLPSQLTEAGLLPVHSAAQTPDENEAAEIQIYPWQVQGFWLTPAEALGVLSHLPLGSSAMGESSIIASDLRYWGHVCRWGLDLLARGKFLPGIELSSQRQTAFWQPLLDSAVDQERLRQFSLVMPHGCLFYRPQAQTDFPAVPLRPLPQSYLTDFLQSLVDEWLRSLATLQPVPATTPLSKELPVREWLQGLSGSPSIDANPVTLSRLREALTTWTAPLQTRREDYRLSLELIPPDTLGEPWLLTYHLQAIADPDWQISAEDIWQHPVEQLRWQQHTIY